MPTHIDFPLTRPTSAADGVCHLGQMSWEVSGRCQKGSAADGRGYLRQMSEHGCGRWERWFAWVSSLGLIERERVVLWNSHWDAFDNVRKSAMRWNWIAYHNIYRYTSLSPILHIICVFLWKLHLDDVGNDPKSKRKHWRTSVRNTRNNNSAYRRRHYIRVR